MGGQATSLRSTAKKGFNPLAASLYEQNAGTARELARDPARGGSQAYDDALTMQEQARRQNLNPTEQGPLGKIADHSAQTAMLDSTRQAVGHLLPDKPNVGGAAATGDAVARPSAQDPVLAAMLVRQHGANALDAALAHTVAGPNQAVGAKLANAIAGTPEKEATLRAGLEALPHQPTQLADMLDVLRATGKRAPPGSNTSIDTALRARRSATRRLRSPRPSAAMSLIHGAGEAVDRFYTNRNASALADMFLGPKGVQHIQALAGKRFGTPTADWFTRILVNAGNEARPH